MLMPKSEAGKATGPDLSTLRTFRVLRPLKLVSGVPSKFFFCFPLMVKIKKAYVKEIIIYKVVKSMIM